MSKDGELETAAYSKRPLNSAMLRSRRFSATWACETMALRFKTRLIEKKVSMKQNRNPIGAYVLRQKQIRYHTCHWPRCGKQVPPAVWGCRTHWFRLPKSLRDRIWAAYRPGQEKDMRPSDEYRAVAKDVQDWITRWGFYDLEGV